MRRWLRSLNRALSDAVSGNLRLLSVILVLRQAGEYTGDPAADVRRILEERYELAVKAHR